VPSDKYPIVPRFADWEFPHDDLPQYWKQCDIPREADAPRAGASIVGLDGSCRITAHREGTQIAHLVPTSEAVWFNYNTMSKYTVDVDTVNDGRNLILLRSDLHSIFDARNFAVVPKLPHAEEKPLECPVRAKACIIIIIIIHIARAIYSQSLY
jgi:hypothetical protein